MSMRKPGPYAPLYANYADDESIMAAGEDAELMYIRMLAYAARTPMTEGWISDRVIASRLGILPRVAGNGAGNEPGTDAGSRAEKLSTVGLIERDRDGYRITSWLKWNRSIEEMGRERARDADRKKPVTSDDDGSDTGNGAGLPDASPLSDQNTDQKQIKRTPAAPVASAEFDAFWAVYPKKVGGKIDAQKAFAKAVKASGLEVIMAGVTRYAADPNLPDRQFIPNPCTWLNGGRWDDGPCDLRTDRPTTTPVTKPWSPWDQPLVGGAR